MTLLAQHGWGKSDKITTALSNGSISGLILSPRDETPENAAAVLASIAGHHPDAARLFDPRANLDGKLGVDCSGRT